MTKPAPFSVIGAVGPPAPVPPRTPEHFVCVRGPCKHYWAYVTMADAGNPEGTWEALGIEAPREYHHACTVHPGEVLEVGETTIYECSRWDPISTSELVQIKTRRDQYIERDKKGKKE